MKRALAILLVAAIAVGLCACGGSTTAQETTAAHTTAATTEAATEPTVNAEEVLAEAEALLFPVDTAPDREAALALVLPLAESGDAHAQYLVGYIDSCAVGAELDYEETAKWYTLSADQGYPRAMTALAELYYSGQGVEADEEKAMELAQQALDLGYAEANYALATICFDKGEYENAMTYYQAGLEGSDPEYVRNCYYFIGTLYNVGYGVEADAQKALEYFQQGAALGDSDCLESIGWVYYGEGDYQKTVEYIRQAADMGNAWAMYYLALFYESEYYYKDLVDQDYQAATDWYQKAAAAGDPNSTEALYRMKSMGYTPTSTSAESAGTSGTSQEYTYVDITMDNWQEYFTLSEVIPVFSGDTFSRFDVTLSLNEPYRDRVARNGKVMSLLGEEITIEISYESYFYKVEADAESQTVTKTRSNVQPHNHKETSTIFLSDENYSFRNYEYGDGFTACLIRGGYFRVDLGSGSTGDAGYDYPDTYEITSISGRLPLLAE